MHVFLKAAACLGCSDGRQVLYRRLEKLGNVEFDLLAQAGTLERLPQFGLFDMGESATQRTLHNVIVDHGQPLNLKYQEHVMRASRDSIRIRENCFGQ